MHLLELSNLKKYYATQKAVDDVSFQISEGSIFGLLGPNGAGNTTLLRMITGIFYPDSGEITFKNKKFDPLRDSRFIGYMPEERGLYKKMKIGEQALYLARLKGLSKAEATAAVKEWFIKFEMQSWWNKKVEDLSKGMGQKLGLAACLLSNRDLMIFDEPMSGLDPKARALVKRQLIALKGQGKTLFYSTHLLEDVEIICDRVMILHGGRICFAGSVRECCHTYHADNLESAYLTCVGT